MLDAHARDRLNFAEVRELLARQALCSLGRARALRIEPAARPDLIRRWLRQITEAAVQIEKRGVPPFGGVSDVREIVRRCAPPLQVDVDDLAAVRGTLAATHGICAWLAATPADAAEMRQLAARVGDFQHIAARIDRVIDDRGQVRHDASPKIARIRAEIEQVQTNIAGAADRLLRDPVIRRMLQYPNTTLHNDRVVLPLRTEYRGRLPGIIHRTSDSGATVYVEPAVVVEANNEIAALRIAEQEEINRLLWELAHEVHLNEAPILQTIDALAILDLIIAKVRFGKTYEMVVPDLSDEPRADVRKARHPLLVDLFRQRAAAGEAPGHVVPIDYRIGVDFDMLVLTGPNTGGKTVALKTIGLLSLMVQAGLPAPVAAGSSFGVFSDVLIDVGDEQSIEQSLSTFSAHLTRLLDMLRKANATTLVLIDELGAGTDPDEGAAISTALLDELLDKGCKCIATTHLGALKSFPLQRPRAENGCVEFDVQTLKPTYRLAIGEPGRSNAIHIARRLGLPPRLVDAAERNLSQQARELRSALDRTARVKRAAEQARAEAHDTQQAARRAIAAAEKAQQELAEQRAAFATWVQRVAHLQPGDPVRVRGFDRDGRVVRLRIDQHRAEVDLGLFTIEVPLGDVLPPETPAPPPAAERPRAAVAVDKKAKAAPPAPSPRPQRPPPRTRPGQPTLSDADATKLRPGDGVYVKRFHRAGTVVRVIPAKKLVIVNVGLLEAEVPFSGLAPKT